MSLKKSAGAPGPSEGGSLAPPRRRSPDHALASCAHLDLEVSLSRDGGGHVGSAARALRALRDRKSTRLNSSHLVISYAVFCLKKKTKKSKPILHSPTSIRISVCTPFTQLMTASSCLH